MRTVPRGEEILFQSLEGLSTTNSDFGYEIQFVGFACDFENLKQQLFEQNELDDLVRDLLLTKERDELFDLRLKKEKFISPEHISFGTEE